MLTMKFSRKFIASVGKKWYFLIQHETSSTQHLLLESENANIKTHKMQRAHEHYILKQLVGDSDDAHLIVEDGLFHFFFLLVHNPHIHARVKRVCVARAVSK